MRFVTSVFSKVMITAAVISLSTDALAKRRCHKHHKSPSPMVVRVATPFSDGHILADTAYQFAEELEKTSRHIDVIVETGFMNEQTINPASEQCDASERVADVLFTGGQPIQDYAPQYFFFNGPYVIRDFDHLISVWNSDIGQRMAQMIEQEGNFVIFDPVYRGYRQFTSNKAINSTADLEGILLRLPPVPDWISVWESLDVVPVQVPLTGIYDALASGTAEASEGDLTQITSLKLYEVQTHLTLTNHLAGFGMPVMNACFYRGELSKRDRKKITRAMKKAIQWGTQTLQENEQNLLLDLQALGLTVITPDAEAIRIAAEPAINALFDTKWNVTTWQEVLAQ